MSPEDHARQQFDLAFERGLEAERGRVTRILNVIRCFGGVAVTIVAAAIVLGMGNPVWRAQLPWFSAYAAVAIALLVAGARWPRFLAGSRFAVAAIDVPMIFVSMLVGVRVAPNPGIVATAALAIYVLLILGAVLTLDRRVIVLTGAVALALHVVMARVAGLWRLDWIAPPTIVISLSVLAGWGAIRRAVALVGDVTVEQTRRANLGRYFSPAVAEQILARGATEIVGERREVSVLFSDLRGFTEVCCDGACSDYCESCGTGSCAPDVPGTVRRLAGGACGAAEFCDGVSPQCPFDASAPAGLVCRAAAGACDVEETCDGVSIACPPDAPAPAGVTCRAPAGFCDVAEACDGSSAACPADAFASPSTVCRPSADACDLAESCTGAVAACPPDGFAPASVVCRFAMFSCDAAESCTGAASACPADALAAAGTVCRAAADACDAAESCDGASTACPADALAPAGTVCRPAAGACDVAETCAGGDAATPPFDTSGDGFPDYRDPDADGDGVDDASDNCPGVANVDQSDADADGLGDLCDDTPEPGGCGCRIGAGTAAPARAALPFWLVVAQPPHARHPPSFTTTRQAASAKGMGVPSRVSRPPLRSRTRLPSSSVSRSRGISKSFFVPSSPARPRTTRDADMPGRWMGKWISICPPTGSSPFHLAGSHFEKIGFSTRA